MPGFTKEFQVTKTDKQDGEGKRVYKGIANTPALDRDIEVIMPKGAIVDNFFKNPVMLLIHNHRALAVGRVHDLKITEEAIEFEFSFAPTKEAEEVEKLYETGIMSAFSIGFMPQPDGYINLDTEAEENITEITFVYPDGSKGKLDLTKYERTPHRVYFRWELLEISPVNVPSNPEALLLRSLEGMKSKAVELAGAGVKGFVEERLESDIEALKAMIERTRKSAEEGPEVSGVVALHETFTEEGASEGKEVAAWDKDVALESLVCYASEDGSGEKDTLSWPRFSAGFAYFNPEEADRVRSYHYLHHRQVPGVEGLPTHKDALKQAMAALLKDYREGDLGEENAKGAYEHLAAHMADLDMEPSAFSAGYTDEELEAIEQGVGGKTNEDASDPDGGGSEAVDTDKVLEVLARIQEDLEALNLKVGIRTSLIQEAVEELAAGNTSAESPKGEAEEDGDGKSIFSMPEELMQRLTSVGKLDNE